MCSQQYAPEEDERLSLAKAALYLLEECRMVLPGMQALLGFELTAVFSSGFHEKLSPAEQTAHLVSVALLALAIVLIMTPAAYHRQTGPEDVSERFIRVASGLLLASMIPFCVSITTELYLVAKVIVGSIAGGAIAALVAAFALSFWFVLPRWHRRKYRNV